MQNGADCHLPLAPKLSKHAARWHLRPVAEIPYFPMSCLPDAPTRVENALASVALRVRVAVSVGEHATQDDLNLCSRAVTSRMWLRTDHLLLPLE